MDFTELRNSVEHLAAVARHHDPETVEQFHEVLAETILTFGQTLIGVYEELAGIRKALECQPAAAGSTYEPGPATHSKPFDQEAH